MDKAYDSFARMLDKEGLDALYICVSPFAHGGPEAAAIERGLPFFVQKPPAVDRDTAEKIAADSGFTEAGDGRGLPLALPPHDRGGARVSRQEPRPP
jgi:hypothetical protein